MLTRGTTSIFIKATKTELTNANQCFVSLYQRILLASLASGKIAKYCKAKPNPKPIKSANSMRREKLIFISRIFLMRKKQRKA